MSAIRCFSRFGRLRMGAALYPDLPGEISRCVLGVEEARWPSWSSKPVAGAPARPWVGSTPMHSRPSAARRDAEGHGHRALGRAARYGQRHTIARPV